MIIILKGSLADILLWGVGSGVGSGYNSSYGDCFYLGYGFGYGDNDGFDKDNSNAANSLMSSTKRKTKHYFKPLSAKAKQALKPIISPFDLMSADNSRFEDKKTKAKPVFVKKIRREA